MNIHNLPLLVITKVTAINASFYTAFSFQVGENEENFIQSLQSLKKLYKHLDIPDPQVILTDHDLVLMKIIKAIFSNTMNLFCVWHIDMNVRKQILLG